MLFGRPRKISQKLKAMLHTTAPTARTKVSSLKKVEPSFMLVVGKLGLGFVLKVVSCGFGDGG